MKEFSFDDEQHEIFGIPFVQYHLPNGRKTYETFECENKTTAELARKIMNAGGKFEAEILSTGHVSLTVVYPVDDELLDIAIKLCANDSSIISAIDALVESAWKYIQRVE